MEINFPIPVQCVWCCGVISQLRDELSFKEWKISGLCQECQDKVFKDE